MDERNDGVYDASAACRHETGRSRRLLLGGAAGGLVLAASGLLLPADLVEDAAADNHPVRRVQHRKEQRRRKNRRERHRKRTQGAKKVKGRNRDKPSNSWPFRDVAIFVHNYWAPPATLGVKGWQSHDNNKYVTPKGWEWSLIPSKAEDGSHSAKEFISGEMDVAVQINSVWVVHAQNFKTETPTAEIIVGTWSDSGRSKSAKTVAHQPMKVWDSMSVDWEGQGKVWIKVTRIPDSSAHIRFSVDLTEVKT